MTIATEGMLDLPKLGSAVIAAGDKVSRDNTAKQGQRAGYPLLSDRHRD